MLAAPNPTSHGTHGNDDPHDGQTNGRRAASIPSLDETDARRRARRRHLPHGLVAALIAVLAIAAISGGFALLREASPDFVRSMDVTNYDRQVYAELCEGQDGVAVDGDGTLPNRWDESDDYQRRKAWWNQMRQEVRYAEIALDHAGKRLGGAWEATSCSMPDQGMLSTLTCEKVTVRAQGRDDGREATIEVDPSTLGCEIVESP